MIFTCLLHNGLFWAKELILWKGTTIICDGIEHTNVENVDDFSTEEAISHLEKTGYIRVVSVKKLEVTPC